MKRIPYNDEEKKMPASLHTLVVCECEKGSRSQTLTVRRGGSSCCAWIELICPWCGEHVDIYIGDGSC